MARMAVSGANHVVPVRDFAHAIEVPAAGRLLFVSGLTARDGQGRMVAEGDVEGQTRRVMEALADVLATAGGSLDDIVQVRTFLVDISQWGRVEAVWRRFWAPPWPASTTVQVSRLFDERQLIEIEAVALLDSSGPPDQGESG